jgi:hypothetical protein
LPPTTVPTASTSPQMTRPTGPWPSAEYATIDAGGNDFVAYIFAGPSPYAARVGEAPHGTTVSILCTANGENVTSPDGEATSNLWYYIRSSEPLPVEGFIASTYARIEAEAPALPACDGV